MGQLRRRRAGRMSGMTPNPPEVAFKALFLAFQLADRRRRAPPERRRRLRGRERPLSSLAFLLACLAHFRTLIVRKT